MDYQVLLLEVKDNIALLKINRPKELNALNSQFFYEMNQMLDEIKARDDVRVVIITGEGKAFAAGADIPELSEKNKEQGRQFSRTGQNVFDKIEHFPLPVIAAVNGYALGGGFELASACDFRIASTKAQFGQPEVNLGLIPGFSGTQRLPRMIGDSNALYILMTGENVLAEEAYNLGLVQRLVEADNLMDETYKVAGKIASKGPKAVQLVKEMVRRGKQLNFNDGNVLESKHFGSLFGTEETKEGINAFLEKRKPNW